MYGAANFTGTLQRVSIGLAVKPVIPDKICTKKRKREGEGGGSREGMLEVPPASIYPKPNLTLSLRHTSTHAYTHLRSHHIIFLIRGHLTAAAYGGRPRSGPTNQPTNQQQPSVARRIAGRNSAPCQLLCGVFSSPYSSLSYFWGDNFSKHVALQVHVI